MYGKVQRQFQQRFAASLNSANLTVLGSNRSGSALNQESILINVDEVSLRALHALLVLLVSLVVVGKNEKLD